MYVGGQGVKELLSVASLVFDRGDGQQKEFASRIVAMCQTIQASLPVVYAVELSGLTRLVEDESQPLLQYYWDPSQPLPETSEIEPSRLIARLQVIPQEASQQIRP